MKDIYIFLLLTLATLNASESKEYEYSPMERVLARNPAYATQIRNLPRLQTAQDWKEFLKSGMEMLEKKEEPAYMLDYIKDRDKFLKEAFPDDQELSKLIADYNILTAERYKISLQPGKLLDRVYGDNPKRKAEYQAWTEKTLKDAESIR